MSERQRPDDGIVIQPYEPWMLADVVALHVEQYGHGAEHEEAAFKARFLDDFSREGSLVLGAVHEGRVIGTQTLTFWPYRLGEERFRSVQSGATLVAEAYRGRGLFSRMLKRCDAWVAETGVPFLTGIPTMMSYGGFIKNGWSHVLSPRWYLRPLKPLAMAARAIRRPAPPALPPGLTVSGTDPAFEPPQGWRRAFADGTFEQDRAREFFAWRHGARAGEFVYFRRDFGSAGVAVMARFQPRKALGINELTIGEVWAAPGATVGHVRRTLAELLAEAGRLPDVHAASLILPPGLRPWAALAMSLGFVPTRKTVPFIVKANAADPRAARALEASHWRPLFYDFDTW